jgi:hypothetical protein
MAGLKLAPDVGVDAAVLCERAAAQLEAQAAKVARFVDGVGNRWLGDCEEGRGWARLLSEKAVGENSLRWLLERHAVYLRVIAGQFRSTTTPYADVDSRVMGGAWPSW